MLNEDAVAMVLLRLRKRLTFGTTSTLYFDISKSRVKKIYNFILPLLVEKLTQYIKLLNKKELINHTLDKLKEIFPNSKIFIYNNNNYVYIQYNNDFIIQDKSFSNYKYRNLMIFIGCAANSNKCLILV
jgi:hypothetical protein